MLYIANILQNVDPDFVKNQDIATKFMHGVNRLFSMQTAGGGFSFWPGQTQPTYWGTAYVTHLLLEGKAAGYPIPQERIDDALQFMENTLSSGLAGRDPKYGYSVAKSEPYMQFVLAKAGRGRKGRLRALAESPPASWGELKEENTFLVQAALYLSGDRTYEKELRGPWNVTVTSKRTNGWSFWSDLRTRGMQLTILEGLFPGSAGAEPLAKDIARVLKASGASRGFTTQELSWTSSGLGKRSLAGPASWDSLTVVVDGKAIAPQKKPADQSGPDKSWLISSASGAKSLSVDVKNLKGAAFAVLNIEGIKPGVPFELDDRTIRVRRSYHTMEGQEIESGDIKLGDLVCVRLTLDNTTHKRIQNIALVDRFGAGLEVENPRLNRGHVVNWTSGTPWDLTYMNLRDDRVEFFGHLMPNQTVEVIYVLRAVTAGDFAWPPVMAEAMYEPKFWSRSGGGRIRIRDPWNAM